MEVNGGTSKWLECVCWFGLGVTELVFVFGSVLGVSGVIWVVVYVYVFRGMV